MYYLYWEVTWSKIPSIFASDFFLVSKSWGISILTVSEHPKYVTVFLGTLCIFHIRNLKINPNCRVIDLEYSREKDNCL